MSSPTQGEHSVVGFSAKTSEFSCASCTPGPAAQNGFPGGPGPKLKKTMFRSEFLYVFVHFRTNSNADLEIGCRHGLPYHRTSFRSGSAAIRFSGAARSRRLRKCGSWLSFSWSSSAQHCDPLRPGRNGSATDGYGNVGRDLFKWPHGCGRRRVLCI